MALSLALHALAAVIWVGGMIFALAALRPVMAAQLEPAQQPRFMATVLGRFFVLVWASVRVLPVTGFWMILGAFGGFGNVGWHIHLMTALGLVMVALYLWLFFRLYRPLRAALERNNMEQARNLMGRIRHVIEVNTALGIIVVLVASGGRYL